MAVQTVLATLRQLETDEDVEVTEVRVIAPDAFAIIFHPRWIGGPSQTAGPVGVRVSAGTQVSDQIVARGPDHQAGDITSEEFASDLANLIIGEPFGEESLGSSDEQGVRWRRLDAF